MTIDELKVLLALNEKQRLVHLESEIFTSEDLYTVYLKSICSKYDFYNDHYFYCSLAKIAYAYAVNIIKGRWPEAEALIMADIWATYFYAKIVIKGRWVEAEKIIATDPQWAHWYAKEVIEGRWLEAESVIATDRNYADWYNKKFGTNL